MADCQDCARDLNRFNPLCLQCGQRYLRDIKRTRLPLEQRQEWLRKALADWMAYGHVEAALRTPIEQPGGKR